MTDFQTFTDTHVLLADGAMGTKVQQHDLSEEDYWNCENCTDVLSLSRPDVIEEIHAAYFAAGADAVETNSFGGSALTLQEFDLGARCFELNEAAARIARRACDRFDDDRSRFVLGSVGPGTRLPSLGHVGYRALHQSFLEQCNGLIAGGVDAMLIETCQDPLQAKAAINAAKDAMTQQSRTVPLICQVTIETNGAMLVGSDISAALSILSSLDVAMIGLNCATGPQEMHEHIQFLAAHWHGKISALPNAGLPEVVDGKPHYPLTPDGLSHWLKRFVSEYGVGMVGGCCGTDETHIQELDQMLRRLAPANGLRPTPKKRETQAHEAAASLYHGVPYRQENAFFNIGERCNANGSRLFKQLQEQEDWDGCVELAREQITDGAHAIDLCTAFVGRNEKKEMNELVARMRGSVSVPLVIDSTEYDVLEQALELYGGKAVINSFNFEDGIETARKRVLLARRFGCGIIGLTIDENGMAKEVDDKIKVAHRLYQFACEEHGLPPHDLFIDPLTFTICTGNAEDRGHGINTLQALKRLRDELPRIQLVLGLSNISFGLNAAARHLLNSVFLHEALKAGMTAAIIHVSRIMPLHQISDDDKQLAMDVIYDKRTETHDPLQRLMARFADQKAMQKKKKERPKDVKERLKLRIIDGDRKGLHEDLDQARQTIAPLVIINEILLDGMKVVGDLFGKGDMQLPFVLQSAETMKQAVSHLEPHLDKEDGQNKGVMVLATVKGDVHDIGKNLVDIILSNNGYRVINLGIKQPLDSIVQAAREHNADAIGMSGLLVKSTVIMRDNLREMSQMDMSVPVILGGAALNRRYVVEECAPIYESGEVAYAQDAFDGLRLMDAISNNSFADAISDQVKRAQRVMKRDKKPPVATELRPITMVKGKKIKPVAAIPDAPFFGSKVISHIPIATLMPYVNRTMLYRFHWGYKKGGKSHKDFTAWSKKELDPLLHRLAKQSKQEEIMHPQACYGYWRCAKEDNALVLFDGDFKTECARFDLPRSTQGNCLCISDFFRTHDEGGDIIALQLVTVGSNASVVAQQWFADDRYEDYLYLHGFGVELAEAAAEYIHRRIRHEWGFAQEDADDPQLLLKQRYRGARYSFGYPACPHLGDQKKLIELLQAEKIGVTLTEEDQLDPEQSTSAIVVHHPDAHYFIV